MRRFITYLYECERGNKSKNIGFIRVNMRNDETAMEVYVRNYMRSNDEGKIYALIHKKILMGIELGEIKIRNGQGDGHIVFRTKDMMGSGYSVNEIVGIGIRLQSNNYFASCWKDEFAEGIAGGEFLLEDVLQEENQKDNDISNETEVSTTGEASITPVAQLAATEERQLQEQVVGLENETWETDTDRDISYEKIDLGQIRDLPSPNWHLCNNSFLVHGFWNYGYLVLKKEMEEGKEKLSLGVPGVFEKPEMVMAVVFGFTDFEALPSEMMEVEMYLEKHFPYKEKNQEPKVGLFGCWFVKLQN